MSGNLREAHPDGHLEARRCIISRSSSLSRVARILRSSLQPVACAACACRSRRASTASQPASNGDHAGNVRAASTWLLLRAFLDKTLRRCDVTGILDREAFFSARKYPPPNNTREESGACANLQRPVNATRVQMSRTTRIRSCHR